MKAKIPDILMLSCVVLLAGCGGGRPLAEQIGLQRSAPDEFLVLSRPALTVPPDFRLPKPGTESLARIEPAASADARSLLIGSEGGEAVEATTGAENVLLSKARVEEADPNIREALKPLEQEEKEAAEKREGFFGGILAKLRQEEPPVIDADAEAERLRQEKANALQESSSTQE